MAMDNSRMERLIEKARESFYEELEVKLVRMAEILSKGKDIDEAESEELKIFFHSIKGTAATLGLSELAEIGLNGEALLEDQDAVENTTELSFYLFKIKEKLSEYNKIPCHQALPTFDSAYVNIESRGMILIVDDDPIILGLLENAFEDEGYSVGILDNPLEIEDAIDKNPPDIVLLDVVMPEMDGYEALKIIKGRYEDIPVVFITGRSGIEDRIKGLKADVDDYIIKPFDIEELVPRIELILKRYNRLKEKLIYDPLTGAHTRQYMNERLEEEFSRYERGGRAFSVAFLDIDKFKDFNDTYGHAAGDYVLKGFAEFILNSIRKSDSLYRYGGEEFVLLMPDTSEIQAMLAVERIREELSKKTFNFEGHEFKITFSAGVKEAEREADDPQGIIRQADRAMYAAKEAGRNRVVIYSEIEKGKPKKRKKVMIVDDENVIAMLIKSSMRDIGVDVTVVRDGDAAVKKAVEERPDLIILDLMLPKMSGFEVLESLKSRLETKGIKVIVVSSKKQDEDIAKVFELGADDYVRKPFSIGELKMRALKQLDR
ncbi:MAG: response regulator [Thermoanaerobacteraceae bacterium]|nr:response regulator [Thermoanaerobacteraceae bacterium]